MKNIEDDLKASARLGHVKFGHYEAGETENYALIERRTKHFAGSLLFYHDPLHIVRGEGARLYDATGREYVDCYNNVQSMGHANREIAKAVADQSLLLNTHTRYLHEEVICLAEEIAETLPGSLDVCIFVNSGTEACELAMRIARTVTGHDGVIVMDGSYHGNSKLVGEMSTATYPASERPSYIQVVESPNTYRGSFRAGFGDDGSLGGQYAELLNPAIEELQINGHGVAAFVCDTIFDSQGALEAPADYFEKVYAKVRSAGGLCVADEVQAGVCRTGTYWGFEQYAEPDIVFTGKPFGGGYPVAAVFTTREIADRWSASDFYFNTFGGNAVSAAAARAVMRYAREQDVLTHVRETGAYLRAGLQTLADKHPVIGNIQGLGLFLGVDLVKDRTSREPHAELGRSIPDAMKQRGIILGLSGPLGNVIKFRPPLVFSRQDADQTIAAFDSVLTELAKR